jgi:hypothetical protein
LGKTSGSGALLAVEPATAELNPVAGKSLEGDSPVRYVLRYADDGRELAITFARHFPYSIEAWEQTQASLAQLGNKRLTTRAKRIRTLMLDYWNRHRPQDRQLRRQLDLPME